MDKTAWKHPRNHDYLILLEYSEAISWHQAWIHNASLLFRNFWLKADHVTLNSAARYVIQQRYHGLLIGFRPLFEQSVS
jgi:hypothetical protein